jgi:hypothetical protein
MARLQRIEQFIGALRGALPVSPRYSFWGTRWYSQDQKQKLVALSEELPQLRVHLNNKILVADQNCQEAKVEENDYTVLTFDDLEYELGLAEGNIRKKIAFVDNQVC